MKILPKLATMLAAVTLGTGMLLGREHDAQLGTAFVYHSAVQASGAADGCVPKDDADARTFAVGVMQCLVGDSKGDTLSKEQASALPEWERTWSSKCEVGISCAMGEGVPQPAPVPHAAAAPSGAALAEQQRAQTRDHLRQLHLLLRARPPLQLAPGLAPATGGLPNLTSVLFNEKASDAIKSPSSLLGDLRGGKTPNLPTGSIIAKAIWGIVPFDQNGKPRTTVGTFYVSTVTNDVENRLSDLVVVAPTSNVAALSQSTNGWDPYPFDSAKVQFDGDCNAASPFTPACMHTFVIDSKADQTALQQIRNDPNNTVFSSNCGHNGCRVVLMGIHFMVRVAPDAKVRVSDNSPLKLKSPWVFFTFWWTGHSSGLDLPAPWKYYQVRVTQDFRDDRITPTERIDRHITYNPYLEGRRPLGAHSNCVTCHQFAAYRAKTSAPNPLACGGILGGADIAPPIPGLSNLNPGCSNSVQEYLSSFSNGNVGSDFVWSFTSLQASP